MRTSTERNDVTTHPSPTLDESKVRDYLLREISTETAFLESQAVRLSDELNETLRLFRALKRSVVTQYYATNRSNRRVHPAIVKAEEEMREDGGVEVKVEPGLELPSRKSKRKKVPRLVPDTGRPLTQRNFRFYVGTMCKALGSPACGQSTHKWTVYVRNCESNPENIVRHIAHVKFMLHESYAPNNVVIVRKAPFKITREGWGEFPMKITIGFVDRENNRNVELVHPVNFLHVKSIIPIISLETPIDVVLSLSEVHTVVDEEVRRGEVKIEGTEGGEGRGSEGEEMRPVKQEVGESSGQSNESQLPYKEFSERKSVSERETISGRESRDLSVEVGNVSARGDDAEREPPDLRQTVLEYLMDADMMTDLEERLELKALEQDIDIT
ncbi:hypothetical protein M8J77_004044 [Diaphorina citri]|nr:hypothetical protein M8J77_004044 [Diaphorina citri]